MFCNVAIVYQVYLVQLQIALQHDLCVNGERITGPSKHLSTLIASYKQVGTTSAAYTKKALQHSAAGQSTTISRNAGCLH